MKSHYWNRSKVFAAIELSSLPPQYRNAGNPLAHYDGTAEEIIAACDGRLTTFLQSTKACVTFGNTESSPS